MRKGIVQRAYHTKEVAEHSQPVHVEELLDGLTLANA